MLFDFDVIVVGGGAGGATFAYACARAGKSVLVLERGDRQTAGDPSFDEKAVLIDKGPYDDRVIKLNGRPKRLYMGGSLGGGTSVYGGALIRPSEQDFQPGRYYGKRIPRAIWDWPISYGDMEPYYTEAERLYGVTGCGEDDFGPLRKPARGFVGEPLPLHSLNQRLIATSRQHGLHPFRLPMAIDSSKCLRCALCAGFVCPTGARGSAAQLLDSAQDQGLALEVQTRVEVERLARERGTGATMITVLDRTTGQRRQYRARRYALAAGAFGSPLLLLRSGMTHPLIGRNYMLHLCAIVAGVYPRATSGDLSFIKQVGFSDYYFGTKEYPHKMGLIQSLAVPGPLMVARASPFLPAAVRLFVRQRMLPLAGIIEDLPNPANCVTLGPDGSGKITHRYGRYDLARRKRMTRYIARILRKSGAVYCIAPRYSSHEHVAHQCGTLRFGTDPTHAVLDPDCRMFANPDIFAVDGSFLPTSLGVGPGLTIMANALRVASKVVTEL
ncbi:FAD-dependent oxidoreductase [Singulisphaera acidiphila]|uniref:Choline dehydrogenase-like flavoprotein n=1 Tax=Singulisphaera acidiphila (strain ATCC BAA-1392 / DSM 18658 / VKM B-2454 / MOB10) TaxID=886293 RepID=L0DG35_SINAD|nr:GMC family oxidoreductase [Singulisphaera acidiphila]AGA28334.1 choline dehydrogenase-like flavoprotein [Singulisphaera acidiphila DSM 18658]